ncbi:MAG TPA: dephospho-CoA kinase [Firmicutes bacterium]|uniref:Dephospho-CoA kinase n=1 Tax=Capillibacterium thermochitinicola TaxID=2699427 RepID=A0A8J6I1C7_9FIRM|nr:dephospho-CoA kinase [Capillibacterium thermochitinicola]MBA2132894.1 dephospho-CoA kinase [Capillibacterium thermochitinicola]HHW11797.1 dephospho-CoA kinase [Bacillota bacterium]
MATGFVIGLTGGLGTGKTTVARILQELGLTVISADQIGHQLLEPGTAVYERVKEFFGPEILDAAGQIDRRALGRIVFRDPEKRGRLNDLTHPAIIARIKAEVDRLKQAGKDVVVEVPLLFEAGLAAKAEIGFDEIWVVAASPAVQLARVQTRDGLGEEEARRRIGVQMPLEMKIARADVVVYNDGNETELKEKVKAIFAARKQAHISSADA